MSTSTQNPAPPATATDRLDLLAGTPDVSPTGMLRLAYEGGALVVSADGSPFSNVGSFLLVDTQVLTGDATTVTFSVGDSDSECLLILAHIIGGAGGVALINIRPNGLTTNQTTSFTANGTPGTLAGLTVGASSATGATSAFQALFFPRAGVGGRPGMSLGYYNDGNNQSFASGYNWNAQTAMTSLDIVASVSNSLGSGSRFSIFKARGGA
jgi:hypothetical protein